jgi:hypothetical protein
LASLNTKLEAWATKMLFGRGKMKVIQILICLVFVTAIFSGCAKYELPSIDDPKYPITQPVDANKDGVIDEKDVQMLKAKADDYFNANVFPFFQKAGIEIKSEEDINTKENTNILKNNLTVAEWEKLTDGMNEWNKIRRQLKVNITVKDEPTIVDSGTVSGFIVTNECLLNFWFKEGRQAQLIGVGIPNNTSGYMLMSRDWFYKLALEKQARIEYDTVKSVKIAGTDQVLLVYLYVGKKFINAEMIAGGYARAKPTPSNNKYDELFKKLEKEARDNKRGIWALIGPTEEF